MYRFIESIRLENGIICHLDWHQKRVNETFTVFFPGEKIFDLKSELSKEKLPDKGLFKIRMTYDRTIKDIEIQPYQPKIIESFTFKEINFEYAFKFEDRKNLNTFKPIIKTEEVIFTKNCYVLDSLFANIALFKNGQWFTPETFLLNGTTRQRLIAQNQLTPVEIKAEDIYSYEKISFINALNDLGILTLDL